MLVLIQCRYLRLHRVHHKKHVTWPTSPFILIYINKIHNRLLFKIKIDISYNYKHLKPENFLVAQKIKQTKQRTKKNVPSLEVVEVVLVQCNIVANQFQ